MNGARSLFHRALMGSSSVALALSLTVALPRDAQALSFVLDFTTNPSTDVLGNQVGAFDPTAYGFTTLNAAQVQQAVLDTVINDYLGYPTIGVDPLSPLPDGQELDIDFEIGTIGTAPANSDPEFYYIQIGSDLLATGFLGQACLPCVRNAAGTGPNGAFDNMPPSTMIGDVMGSIFTDTIAAALAGFATTDAQRINLIAGTTSHEIGHTVSLVHPSAAQANPGASTFGLMATGAPPTNMPNNQRILDRDFSYTNFTQLIGAIGTRDVVAVPEPSTLLLLGFGVAGLVGWQWRKKRLANS